MLQEAKDYTLTFATSPLITQYFKE